MSKPPPLPAEVLSRVLRIATWDGRLLAIVAGSFALISLAYGDVTGAIISGLAAGAGVIELRGCRLLRLGELRGIDWLVRSQLSLLGVILLYVGMKLINFDLTEIRRLLTPQLITQLNDAGLDLSVDEILALVRTLLRIALVTTAVVSIFYQGGLAFFYSRRRRTIQTALKQ